MMKMDEKLFNNNAESLQNFLSKSYGRTVEPNTLIETFKKNTPMYTAKHFDALARGI